jgi:hypothetical protein
MNVCISLSPRPLSNSVNYADLRFISCRTVLHWLPWRPVGVQAIYQCIRLIWRGARTISDVPLESAPDTEPPDPVGLTAWRYLCLYILFRLASTVAMAARASEVPASSSRRELSAWVRSHRLAIRQPGITS